MEISNANVLYNNLIEAWNQRDASAFATLFGDDSICIGFDGSEMKGKSEIFSQLDKIFSNHETARYVAIIRETKSLTNNVMLVRADVGMIPPNKNKIDPSKNAIQVMIGRFEEKICQILLFQNTPAQFHGRPEAQKQLTEELQEVANRNEEVAHAR